MKDSLAADVSLPPGTVVAIQPPLALWVLSWQSPRGLHIVRCAIPLEWCCQPGHGAQLHAAIRQFTQVTALEILAAQNSG